MVTPTIDNLYRYDEDDNNENNENCNNNDSEERNEDEADEGSDKLQIRFQCGNTY